MLDVQQRFEQLRESQAVLNLYALIDGFQYEQHTGQRLQRAASISALFDDTEDAPLAHAGPWLIHTDQHPEKVEELGAIEQALPAVSWLITAIDHKGLTQLLRLKLDTELPDGKKALVRFYDPRVLGNLYQTMTDRQRAEFFHLIDEWHFLYNGRRVWTGRTDA